MHWIILLLPEFQNRLDPWVFENAYLLSAAMYFTIQSYCYHKPYAVMFQIEPDNEDLVDHPGESLH